MKLVLCLVLERFLYTMISVKISGINPSPIFFIILFYYVTNSFNEQINQLRNIVIIYVVF